MSGWIDDIEERTRTNKDFRHVVYTGNHLQLLLMSIRKGDEIGSETHADHDQFFRVERGKGEVVINDESTKIRKGDAIIVPAGAKHNVINTGNKSLKLYTLYAPPEHQDGAVRHTREEAEDKLEHFDGATTE